MRPPLVKNKPLKILVKYSILAIKLKELEMDFRTVREVLRLHRLEELARAHREHAIERGNMTGAMRAIRLETAALGKAQSIMMCEVTPYSDYL